MNMKKRILAIILVMAFLTLSSGGNVFAGTPIDAKQAVSTAWYTEIKTSNTNKVYMYDFRDQRNYGHTNIRGDEIDFEGYEGIRLDTSSGRIAFAVYNHSKRISNNNIQIDLYKANDNNKHLQTLGKVSIPNGEIDSEWYEITGEFDDGLYRINSKFLFTPDNSYDNVSGYVYIKNGKPRTCRIKKNTTGIHSDKFDKLLKDNDTNPKNYLSNAKNTYPTNGTNGSCVHRKEWEAKADEIIRERNLENATNEAKVFFFTEWLAENIAYDEWRVTTNKNKSRATYYNRWNDDKLFCYYNGVGQCWDFVNAMAIMCRHAGIPCTDVANDGHTITCVWMNEGWVCIDITLFTQYTNWELKPDPSKYKEGEWNDRMRDYYGYYPSDMNAWEACIWEEKNNQK